MTILSTTLGSGPAMLLLHGWGMSGAVWETLAAEFSASWTTIAVDLPGHGRSRGVAGDADLPAVANEIRGLAGSDPVWIGWSLGGLVALAAAHGKMPRAIVLIASTPCFVRRPDWDRALKAIDLQALALQVTEDPEQALTRYLSFQLADSKGSIESLRFLRSIIGATGVDRDALLWWLDVLKTTDMRAFFASISCPILVILGDRDPVVPVAVGEDLANLNKSAHVRIIADAAHAPMISHPELVAASIKEFLRDV